VIKILSRCGVQKWETSQAGAALPSMIKIISRCGVQEREAGQAFAISPSEGKIHHSSCQRRSFILSGYDKILTSKKRIFHTTP
jgi:hypothetical protein